MKQTLLIFSIAAMMFSCSSGGEKPVASAEAKDTAAAATAEQPKANWEYSEQEDRMTNEKQFFAQCNSTNEVKFKFPYDGGSTFRLVVRNMEKQNEVMLAVSKGQFMPSVMGDKIVKVKFDEGQPMDFKYSGTSDGTGNVIFLSNANKFITNVKKAKKLLIAAEFFQEGTQYMEFDVEGLSWDK